MYDTSAEAEQKLGQSVVLFDGCPVYISGVAGSKADLRLYYTKLPLGAEWTGKSNQFELISDPRWDFKSVGARLGYTAVRSPMKVEEIIWCSRIPIRHSRQGLDQKTIYIKRSQDSDYPYDWGCLIHAQGLVQTMRGQYAPVSEAFKMLLEKPGQFRAIPISRKMALEYDRVSPPYLLYRGEKVGYTEDGSSFKIAKHKNYLTEELVDMENLKIA